MSAESGVGTPATSKRPRTAAERAATNPGGRATFFEPTLLCALAIRPAHGYALRGAVEDLTDGLVVMDLPGVYRLLKRFEAEGLASSSWGEGESGPRRHTYTLTPEGHALLSDWRSFLSRQVHVAHLTMAAIDAVLDVWVRTQEPHSEPKRPTGESEVRPPKPELG